MDEEKKKRLQELASQEAYEEECRQNNESDSKVSHTDVEDNNYYVIGQKIGKWVHHWIGLIILVVSALVIIILFIGVMINIVSTQSASSKSTTTKTDELTYIWSVTTGTIYKSDDVVVSTTGDFTETSSKITITLMFENLKDSDSTYVYYGGGINGLTVIDGMSVDDVDILAGKKATAKLNIDKSVLKKDGFSNLYCIDVSLQPYHWLLRSTSSTIIFGRIWINGYDAETQIDYAEYPELYNENGIIVQQMSLDNNKANFVILNQTEYPFEFSLHDVSVNDITYDTEEWLEAKNGYIYSNDVVLPGCRYIFSISVKSGFLSDSKIDEIKNIEYEIHISAGQILTGGNFDDINIQAIYE